MQNNKWRRERSSKSSGSLRYFPGVLQKGEELVSIIVDIVGTIKDIHNFINKKVEL